MWNRGRICTVMFGLVWILTVLRQFMHELPPPTTTKTESLYSNDSVLEPRISCTQQSFTEPMCSLQFDQRHTCEFVNSLCYVNDEWLVLDPNGTFSTKSMPHKRPYLKPFGELFYFRSVDELPNASSDTLWIAEPTVIWEDSVSLYAHYYQWLVEDMGALFWLAYEVSRGYTSDSVIAVLVNDDEHHSPLMRVFVDRALNLYNVRNKCFRRAIVGAGCRSLLWSPKGFRFERNYVDFMNLDPTLYSNVSRNTSVERLTNDAAVVHRYLRRRLLRAFPVLLETPSSRIVALVVRVEKRRLLNRDELIYALATRLRSAKLVVVHPAGMSRTWSDDQGVDHVVYNSQVTSTFRNQVYAYGRASIILGVHGAGLSNQIFMKSGSVVYEFFGHHHVNTVFEVMAKHVLRHRYRSWRPPLNSTKRACRVRISSACKNMDFHIDTDEVVRVVNELL